MLPLLALACAPRPFPEDALPTWEERPVVGSFSADLDEVWDASVQVLGERAPLERIDKGAGMIETGWVLDFSDYIFKTFGGTRIPEPIRWRMRASVYEAGGRVEVKMVGHEQVEKDMISANLTFTGNIYEWIDVPSSTNRERELLEEVLSILDDRKKGGDYDYDYAQ